MGGARPISRVKPTPKPGLVRCVVGRTLICGGDPTFVLVLPLSTKVGCPLGLILYYQGKHIYTQRMFCSQTTWDASSLLLFVSMFNMFK